MRVRGCCSSLHRSGSHQSFQQVLKPPLGLSPLRRMLLLRLQNQLLLCCGGPKKHHSDLGGSQATANPRGSEDHLCQQSLRRVCPEVTECEIVYPEGKTRKTSSSNPLLREDREVCAAPRGLTLPSSVSLSALPSVPFHPSCWGSVHPGSCAVTLFGLYLPTPVLHEIAGSAGK